MIKDRKKLYILIVVAALVLIAVIWGTMALGGANVTQTIVTFEPSAGSTITFGTQYSDTPAIAKQILTTTTRLSKTLQPGNYVAIFSEAGRITQSQPVTVDGSTTIKTPVLSYTDARLAETLKLEKSATHQAVFRAVRESDYTISNEGLYTQADWYFADLSPNSTSLNEYKLILKKNNSRWIVATKPAIVFSIDDYPDIPSGVIRAANKLGFY